MIAQQQRIDIVKRGCTVSYPPPRCKKAHCKHAVVRAYYDLHPDGHFFDDDTMRFFASRVVDFNLSPDGYYFVTSELVKRPRMYTVRFMQFSASEIVEISEFQEYASRTEAVARMRRESVKRTP